MAAGPVAAPPAYTDQQMRAFANATLDLQALGSQDNASMTHVIEATGMSVEQYNEMGDALRADPALAARLDPYLQTARIERPVSPADRSQRMVSYSSGRSHSYGAPAARHRSRGHAATRHRGKTSAGHHRRVNHAASHRTTKSRHIVRVSQHHSRR